MQYRDIALMTEPPVKPHAFEPTLEQRTSKYADLRKLTTSERSFTSTNVDNRRLKLSDPTLIPGVKGRTPLGSGSVDLSKIRGRAPRVKADPATVPAQRLHPTRAEARLAKKLRKRAARVAA